VLIETKGHHQIDAKPGLLGEAAAAKEQSTAG